MLNISFGDLKMCQFMSREGPVVPENRNSELKGSVEVIGSSALILYVKKLKSAEVNQ